MCPFLSQQSPALPGASAPTWGSRAPARTCSQKRPRAPRPPRCHFSRASAARPPSRRSKRARALPRERERGISRPPARLEHPYSVRETHFCELLSKIVRAQKATARPRLAVRLRAQRLTCAPKHNFCGPAKAVAGSERCSPLLRMPRDTQEGQYKVTLQKPFNFFKCPKFEFSRTAIACSTKLLNFFKTILWPTATSNLGKIQKLKT